MFEVLGLMPPRAAVVTHEVTVFLECGIIVCREHLAVGINVHAGTFGLFQQFFHVLQVVSADEDTRVVAHAQVHLRDLRMSVARGVGLVEQRHHLDPLSAGLQHECRQFIHGKGVVGDGHQCFLHKCVDAILFMFQVVCMLRIGSHSL